MGDLNKILVGDTLVKLVITEDALLVSGGFLIILTLYVKMLILRVIMFMGIIKGWILFKP